MARKRRARPKAAARASSVQRTDDKSRSPLKGGEPEDTKVFIPETPAPLIVFLLLAFVVLAGHRAAPYVADPQSVPGPWRDVVAAALAAVVYLSLSVLTTLTYCLLALREVELAKQFLRRVGAYSALGAALGTLLGAKIALPLWSDRSTSPGVTELTFVEWVSIVSNTATVMTLLFLALCWPYAYGPVRASMAHLLRRSSDGRQPYVETNPRKALAIAVALLVLFSGNFAGLQAGVATWQMLKS